jgi:hypothetical protein
VENVAFDLNDAGNDFPAAEAVERILDDLAVFFGAISVGEFRQAAVPIRVVDRLAFDVVNHSLVTFLAYSPRRR